MQEFVKIRSWHVVRTPTRVPNTYATLCGRRAAGQTSAIIPGNEPSCESCLRIKVNQEEGPQPA